MAFRVWNLLTAVAWGKAFHFASETIVIGVSGAKAGAMFGRGHTIDEVAATVKNPLATWQRFIPFVAAALGVALALTGILPGARREEV
jgi:ABC-type anion transport system duplicated permease subunit